MRIRQIKLVTLIETCLANFYFLTYTYMKSKKTVVLQGLLTVSVAKYLWFTLNCPARRKIQFTGRSCKCDGSVRTPFAHFHLRPARPRCLFAQRILFVEHSDESLSHPCPQSLIHNSNPTKLWKLKSYSNLFGTKT